MSVTLEQLQAAVRVLKANASRAPYYLHPSVALTVERFSKVRSKPARPWQVRHNRRGS